MHLAISPCGYVQASDRHKDVLGHLMVVAQQLAHQGERPVEFYCPPFRAKSRHFPHALALVCASEGLGEDGFRLVVNDGKNGCALIISIMALR